MRIGIKLKDIDYASIISILEGPDDQTAPGGLKHNINRLLKRFMTGAVNLGVKILPEKIKANICKDLILSKKDELISYISKYTDHNVKVTDISLDVGSNGQIELSADIKDISYGKLLVFIISPYTSNVSGVLKLILDVLGDENNAVISLGDSVSDAVLTFFDTLSENSRQKLLKIGADELERLLKKNGIRLSIVSLSVKI